MEPSSNVPSSFGSKTAFKLSRDLNVNIFLKIGLKNKKKSAKLPGAFGYAHNTGPHIW
jgi:hypothetical protein